MLSLAAGPTVAPAQSRLPWELPHPTKFAAAFTVRSADGATIGVIGWGHNVLLAVRTQGDDESGAGSQSVEYLARGTVTAHRISARFGDLGEVSVRFHQKGKIAKGSLPFPLRPAQQGCGSRIGPDKTGLFTGTIRFRGEGGYASVNAKRAKGLVGRPPSTRCGDFFDGNVFEEGCPEASGSGEGPGFLEESLADERALYLLVGKGSIRINRDPPKSLDLYLAGSLEHSQGVAISRSALAVVIPSELAYDPALRTMTVTPPAPFSGTATFRANPDGTAVSEGTLALAFAGVPDPVSLTGPGFSGLLCD
jgi:hypothetical protein